MSARSSGHVAVGATSAVLGALALGAGVVRPGPLAGFVLGTPFWALLLTGGGVLSIAGALILLFTLQRNEEPEPEIPAHVAFSSRMSAPDIVPGLAPTPRPAAASRSVSSAATAVPRLPAPDAPAQQRVAPRGADLAKIDGEIRELSKKINKAGVMLATGQLSQQGYLAYVDDLKRQRGALEAQRVRAELKT